MEHVFGAQKTMQGGILVRTKGKLRAAVKIGMMNLTYNMRASVEEPVRTKGNLKT